MGGVYHQVALRLLVQQLPDLATQPLRQWQMGFFEAALFILTH